MMDRRRTGLVVSGGLCVAGAVAIVALLQGSFGDTEWRLIGTSLGFAVFSATGAAGDALRQTCDGSVLGSATALASAVAFVLLVVALWGDGADTAWRAWGVAGVVALAASHGSLMLRYARSDDPPLVWGVTRAAVVFGVVEAVLAGLAITGAVETDETAARVGAVLVVLLILTTALPSILRRGAGDTSGSPVPAPRNEVLGSTRDLAAAVLAASDRIDRRATTPEVRREVQILRELARRALG